MRLVCWSRLTPVLFLALLASTAGADWNKMDLAGHRWYADAGNLDVWVGRTDVGNMTRGQTITALQDMGGRWTSQITGSTLGFTLVDDGNIEYPPGYDPIKPCKIWWTTAMACSLGNARKWTVEQTLHKRIRAFEMRFGDGDPACLPWGNYCFWDCNGQYTSCGVSDFDVPTIPGHEWGHVVGLGHYSECDWLASLMWRQSDAYCSTHRYLGYEDRDYLNWFVRDITYDLNEPGNDNSNHAVLLGNLQPGGDEQLGVESNNLPGYADVDWWRVEVEGVSGQVWDIGFYTMLMDGPPNDYDIAMSIYYNNALLAEVNNSGIGGDEEYSTQASDGQYLLGLTPPDHRGGGEYVLVCEIWHVVSSVPEVEITASDEPKFEVMTWSQQVRIAGLETEGRLSLYDIGGRRAGTWHVDAQRDQEIDLRGEHLPTGIYFLQLSSGTYTKNRKMLVIR